MDAGISLWQRYVTYALVSPLMQLPLTLSRPAVADSHRVLPRALAGSCWHFLNLAREVARAGLRSCDSAVI